ncbi:SpoIID/LytB domain-containing protein [Serpentinicella sp. ANB-PHB4]|uniref:SpoIID/LytB domain-containing protein n=1 Tax=Serpentinicella sp. ANB-PHB4 TaxID=3074076 RepID=UPI00285889FA|nr:SpoIID/LytB domain-containing protein [Serpentinicella sp. ANB-PHB4]MDR5659945.1 SpoIID/LytB domain-containing protein [Serpentinicella sp. ANB-PHB4]
MKKIKKINALFLIIVLSFVLIVPKFYASASSDYSTIRVRLSISKSSIPIVIDGEYYIAEKPNIDLKRGDYTVSVASNNRVRIRGNGIDETVGTSLTLIRTANNGSGNNHMTIKGTDHGDINYLGNMHFTVRSGNLRVINHIPVEQYLPGVVAYEMSNSFPLEALKAQAVTARGYAVNRISSSGDHDIGDTEQTQVYRGYNPTNGNVIQAVNETKGEVLKYNGEIISAYYSASNGGFTELPGNAWGFGDSANNAHPYLVIREDPYDLANPNSLYHRLFIPSKVEGSDYDTTTLDSDYAVRIVKCNTWVNVRTGPGSNYAWAGRGYLHTAYEWISSTTVKGPNGKDVIWHKIKHDNGTVYIHSTYGVKTENGRYLYANPALGDLQTQVYEKLKSDKNIDKATDIKINTVNSLENGEKRWPNTDSTSYVTANANVTVQYHTSGSSSLSSKTDVDVEISLMNRNENGTVLRSHEYFDSNMIFRGVESTKDGYYLTNGRFGHGVGMSQRGAQQMASVHNKKHYEILDFYFAGTKLEKVDTTVPSLPKRPELESEPNPEPEPAPKPEVPKDPKLSSNKYTVNHNNSSITGLSTKLNVRTFLDHLSISDGSIKLLDASGKEKKSGVVATGDVLEVRTSDNKVHKRYPLIIYGDVNGNGDIMILDLLRIQRYLLNTSDLKEPYKTAADITRSGSVTILDLLRLQRHLLGTTTIKQ